jgi:hypothetical protein
VTTTAQAYPLWCAVLEADRTIRTGRVVAWHAPHAANIAPIVAFDDNGQFIDAHTVTGRLFLGDSHGKALSAAMDAQFRTCSDHHESMTRIDDHQWRCPVGGCLNQALIP